jgi:hypothetical protein
VPIFSKKRLIGIQSHPFQQQWQKFHRTSSASSTAQTASSSTSSRSPAPLADWLTCRLADLLTRHSKIFLPQFTGNFALFVILELSSRKSGFLITDPWPLITGH